MAQEAKQGLLKTLCEQAAHEPDGQKVLELVNEINELLDHPTQQVAPKPHQHD
jgi:hypothetical protein